MASIITIDPGKNGAAVISLAGDMYEARFNRLTEADISKWFFKWLLVSPIAYLEKVHAMPRQGVTSMFTFGNHYGFIRGILTAYGIPYEEISPIKWQRALGVTRKDRSYAEHKRFLKQKAQQYYPNIKMTLDNADAWLMQKAVVKLQGV